MIKIKISVEDEESKTIFYRDEFFSVEALEEKLYRVERILDRQKNEKNNN